MRKLTGKQQAFVEHYCGDCRFNATKAAIRAGYSPKTAYSIGNENLKKPEVIEVIDKRLAAITQNIEITAENIALEISAVAFGIITPGLSAQANITNKLRALELLGRYRAMFTDNISRTGDGLNLNFTTTDDKPASEATGCPRIAKVGKEA